MLPVLLLVLAAPPKLTVDERKVLDELSAILVDPRGAERVIVTPLSLELGGQWKLWRYEERCWQLPTKEGQARRVVSPDGGEVLFRSGIKRIDFVADVRARIARPGGNPVSLEEAVWLHRLGKEVLAARVLSSIESLKHDAGRLRQTLCHFACHEMVAHMQVGDDRRALDCGLRAERARASEDTWSPWMIEILADLRRREKAGTLGRRMHMPAGFAGWQQARRIAWLIESLEDTSLGVDKGCLSTHYGPRSDPRYRALIAEGDAAVPALIDAIEKDTRVTRAFRGVTWTGGYQARFHMRSVRETACDILMYILHASALLGVKRGADWQIGGRIDDDRFPDGKNIDPKGLADTVKKLRGYWRVHGGRSPRERHLAHLGDLKAKPEVWRESAFALSRTRPDPAGPAAALAILDAMDRHSALPDSDREELRDFYLDLLVDLRDPRALPVLSRRLRFASVEERRHFVDAMARMGMSGPLSDYAREFEKGTLRLPEGDAGEGELDRAVRMLATTRTPAGDRALEATARPGHWAHARVRAEVLYGRYAEHPFVLGILADALSDGTRTGRSFRIDGNDMVEASAGRERKYPLPKELAGAKTRAKADERAGDLAGATLSYHVRGSPYIHASLEDIDERLKGMKAFMALHKGKLRRLAYAEAETLEPQWIGPFYAPDIRPLGRAATEADVKAGRAVFHLSGKGKPLEMRLPAIAELKGGKGLIVQAESLDGKPVYGVILRNEIRRVEAKEVFNVSPLPK